MILNPGLSISEAPRPGSLTVPDIVEVISRSDLSTYDPYDIWKTRIGFHCKNLYNRRPVLGIIPAAALEIFDLFINNRLRFFCSQQEYPIVRALSTLCLLNLHELRGEESFLASARTHLDWLIANAVQTRSGLGWGLGFWYAVQRDMVYTPTTPFSTMTPYILEAIVAYSDRTRSKAFTDEIRAIQDFFLHDLHILEEGPDWIATSYTDMPDRVVTNAVSYAMFSLSLTMSYRNSPHRPEILSRIRKLYNFVRNHQQEDGSWFYSPRQRSFIDCFHSCIILKNILKARQKVDLDGSQEVVERGYQFIKENFLDDRHGLYRRFTVRNKPNPIAFDLYDNAEILSLSVDMKDFAEAERLSRATAKAFVRGTSIWSKISILGTLHDRGTLRWAVLPYMYALTKLMLARRDVSPPDSAPLCCATTTGL